MCELDLTNFSNLIQQNFTKSKIPLNLSCKIPTQIHIHKHGDTHTHTCRLVSAVSPALHRLI